MSREPKTYDQVVAGVRAEIEGPRFAVLRTAWGEYRVVRDDESAIIFGPARGEPGARSWVYATQGLRGEQSRRQWAPDWPALVEVIRRFVGGAEVVPEATP